ncbi:alpha/beta fold hydrolase [Pararhizobium sp. DWP3-4]|uniref:alpha/beta fold hydrolase n=1 Tax=Pararhizobium sp. DWP3-4 TaxID=2804565 RepID=UPI003CEB42FE
MFAEINGTRIFFDIEGTGLASSDGELTAKPTLVALHGGPGFDHGYLRPGLSALSEIAQVVYVDLRGQGRSDRPSLETCTLEQMADDIAGLCLFLGIEKPVLFGHSAGGFVSMHIALRHPHLPKGMILSGSSASMKPGQEDGGEHPPPLASRASSDVVETAARVFAGDITEESVAAFLRKVGPFYGGPAHMQIVSEILRLTTANIDIMKHFMVSIGPRYDLLADLCRIDVPTLVMVGRYDWICPPRASRAIARGIPEARIIQFENSGHFLFSEEPNEFLYRTRLFLDSLR